MRKTGNVQGKRRLLLSALTLALMLVLGLFTDSFALVSHAQSQGKVTASSANIRKEPDGSSQVIGSTEKDKVITINNQVQGSDGYTWYQTFVNSETLGYIRADLVEITDGTTPTTVTQVTPTTPNTTTNTNTNETPAEVTVVNPVSATVSGGSSVRIRSNASTTSQIVTTASNGLALTVTGTANGSDGKVWYQVSFSSNGSEVQGFIRSDFVTLSGELTPYTEPPAEQEPITDPDVPAADPEPETVKDFDTRLIDGEWYLVDNVKLEQYGVQDLFDKVTNNAAAYEEANKKVKTEKVVIIILVLLLVAAAAAVALLVFKIKDMADEAYFNEVENETMKKRGAARTQGGSQKVMHTVGAEKSAGATQGKREGQRPVGARPAGAPQGGQQSQRPAGARPAGTRPAGAPQGGQQSQRPAGARPAGASQGSQQSQRPAGARPAGVSQGSQQSQRPAGARPAGVSQGSQQSQRPAGARPAGAPQGSQQSQRPAGARPAGAPQGGQQGWQSKNFMADDDDEFEFEFLNYDGDDEQ